MKLNEKIRALEETNLKSQTECELNRAALEELKNVQTAMTVIDKENENLKVEASDLKKKIAKANDDIKTKDKIMK